MSNPFTPYGLSSNPYGLPRLKSFDPEQQAVEPILVDGFRELREEGPLHKFFLRRREVKKPAYVLVRGKSGIGRTSAARHILRQYGKAAGAKKMIAPEIDVNSDPWSVVRSWLRNLKSAINDSLASSDKEDFFKLIAEEQLNEASLARLDDWLKSIDFKLGDHNLAFGFCIDDPPEMFPHSKLVQQVFSQANLVVVIVVHTDLDEESDLQMDGPSDPLLGLFRNLQDADRGWIFPRKKLTEEDAHILADEYWRRARKDVDCPVPRDAIKKLWTDSSLALADVLQVLAIALHQKAEKASGRIWPGNPELGISGDDLCDVRSTLEKSRLYNPRWRNAGYIP